MSQGLGDCARRVGAAIDMTNREAAPPASELKHSPVLVRACLFSESSINVAPLGRHRRGYSLRQDVLDTAPDRAKDKKQMKECDSSDIEHVKMERKYWGDGYSGGKIMFGRPLRNWWYRITSTSGPC